jgi:hypothetical protein
MPNSKKLLQAAAGQAGGGGLNVEDLFSTYLYDGTSAEHTITNGIDLDGEGGMIWGKIRSAADQYWLVDSERGTGSNSNYKYLMSNLTNGELDFASRSVSSFNSNGFTLQNGTDGQFNESGHSYASWTFRKAPKFFDVQTWSGDSASDRAISHNLGCVPGMIIVKRTNASEDWGVWHRSVHANTSKVLYLNQTVSLQTSTNIFGATNPTDSNFYVGDHPVSNNSGDTYVAYIFAHNNGDGEFGPDSDQDIIKCGSYTGNHSTLPNTISLGFEPQWVMVKKTNGSSNWAIWDVMRGMSLSDNAEALEPNTSTAEASTGNIIVYPTADGFEFNDASDFANFNGNTYIYMAIRRGPLAAPESATEVFGIDVRDDTDAPMYKSGFVTDFSLYRDKVGGDDWRVTSRLQGTGGTFPEISTAAESSAYTTSSWDWMNGFHDAGSVNTGYLSWMWKRAPGYFDAVAYTGNGTAGRTVSHNLGVAPEMMWVKSRSTDNWHVYHSGLNVDGDNAPETDYIYLDLSAAAADGPLWNDTAPTATDFTLFQGSAVNGSGTNYIAYLFASLDGISKVGSYTGTGSSQTIDCGFTSGARFVLIKRTDSADDWIVVDTVRGIVSGNDPYLALNTTDPQGTTQDYVDPNSSGFIVTGENPVGASGGSYIFYAIA